MHIFESLFQNFRVHLFFAVLNQGCNQSTLTFKLLKSQNASTEEARQSFDAFQIRRGVVHKKGCYS
jgi:hypothetical protein